MNQSPGTEAGGPSRAAQKLIALGVMAWGAKVELPRSRRANAERHFYSLILKARKLGFHESTKFISGLRAGKATPKVVERAEAVCSLITEAEIDAELRSAASWERQVGVHGSSKTRRSQPWSGT